jgi:hypothetical protein
MSKKLLKLVIPTTILSVTLFTMSASAASLSLFNNTLKDIVYPNCTVRPEYNQFMNQWTNNEVCNPKIVEVDTANPYSLQQAQQVAPTSYYTAPVYYSGSNTYYPNTWNGYGNASNYLLSSFGGGYGGDYGSNLRNLNYYYGGYSYPNSVINYTPTVDEYFNSVPYYNQYSLYSSPSNNFNYSYDDGDYIRYAY